MDEEIAVLKTKAIAAFDKRTVNMPVFPVGA